jgi:hypothetical protein
MMKFAQFGLIISMLILSQTLFGQPESFYLAGNSTEINILVDQKDSKTVLLSARLFAEDIERVSNYLPQLVSEKENARKTCVIIGSIEGSSFIRKLISTGQIEVSQVRGQWESCLTQIINNPFPGIDKALVIAGSDRRGTAYGVFELSKQIGVSPWYYFADVTTKKNSEVSVSVQRTILESPSVQYRGIFINDEMWGLRPWAMNTLAPEEGKGIGPTTYGKIFELLLRLKANLLWPAMHQQTRPFNYYEYNKVLADEFGIIMGSSHIEPMLRNNIGGAEWDTEYPNEPWDYVKNKKHIYAYWEDRVKANGMYENMYTIGKRGKDDEAGSDITVPVLEQIFKDQRSILKKHVNRDVTKVPQVLIPYTEVLGLYNQGLKVPDDVIICWPDDNFGNIRQLPNDLERAQSGGSGIYYHFQWLNGATTAYTWTCTTPLGLTWSEMKKAYDFGAHKLWVVNVGDIKPAEINIEYFMQLAWDIDAWDFYNSSAFIESWAARDIDPGVASEISLLMQKHYELGYARRPESLVMWNGREQKLSWEWFNPDNYDDEVDRRIQEYQGLVEEVDRLYELVPWERKDAFFQTVVYNVKGTALQNIKVLNAQKSNIYGAQNRASAASYAAKAQNAEEAIYELIHHYNRELLTVGDKWDHMASLPGPWGGQWRQWDMPELSFYSGEGTPKLGIDVEGTDSLILPGFSVYNSDQGFIDLYNTGNGAVYWSSSVSEDWIQLSEKSGVVYHENRIWVDIDWEKVPYGEAIDGSIVINWSTAINDEWQDWNELDAEQREDYKEGTILSRRSQNSFEVTLNVFNPKYPSKNNVRGFVESNGYISIEAEHFSRRISGKKGEWEIIQGLGRTGNSVTVLPVMTPAIDQLSGIIKESACLEYDIYTFSKDSVSLQLNCIPSNPINGDYGVRLAVAFDDNEPEIISYQRGNRNVMDNLMTLHGRLHLNKAGEHILKVWMVDPGIVIDKVIINTGGLKDSYLGPPESFSN